MRDLNFSSFSLVDRRWMENQPLPEVKILLRGGQGLPSRSSVGSRCLNKATAAFQEISGMLSCNATRLFLVTQQLAVEGLIIFLGEERQFVPLEPLETFLLRISRRPTTGSCCWRGPLRPETLRAKQPPGQCWRKCSSLLRIRDGILCVDVSLDLCSKHLVRSLPYF